MFIVIDQCLLTSDPARLRHGRGLKKAAEGGFLVRQSRWQPLPSGRATL